MGSATDLLSSEDLRRVLDSALGVALIACDVTGTITSFSRGAELMLGFEASEVVGTQTPLLFHDSAEVEARAAELSRELGRPLSGFEVFVARLAGQQSEGREWTYVRKDGARLTVSLTVSPISAADGQVIGYLGTAVDISQHKATELALSREKDFVEQVINGLPGVFYLYDKELRLRRWNRNHETLLGYSDEELDGFFVGDWHPTEDLAQLAIGATRGIIEQGVRLDAIESALLHKNGTYVPFLLTGVRIVTEQGPMMAGVGIDLTERRKLEEQLRQSQKMESIGRLAGGIAHDFNNVLTTIMGNLDLSRIAVEPSSRVLGYLDNALRAAESAAMLTRQLLAFSRKQLIAPRTLDLNEVVAGMRGVLNRLLGEDITLALRVAPELWPVTIDPGQLDQVLLNLVVNARDAMPDGGRLSLETQNVSLGDDYVARHPEATAGDYVMLAVSDTGVGMSQEVQSRIFEPFFTTKGVGQGTGLGLATVFGALKQNGGLIEVHSEVGIGSTFKVLLPRAFGPAEHLGAARSADRVVGGHETILLAEDDEGIRDVAEECLTQLGYRVLACPDGGAALDAALAAGTIDLLITDLIMPDMNGRELATRLRARLKSLKVLYSSGYTADIIGRHGVLEAGVEFLPKPYGPSELARRVRLCLDVPLRERT